MAENTTATILSIVPGTPSIEAYTPADLRRLAAEKGLTVQSERIHGARFYHIMKPGGQVLLSTCDKVRAAFYLQERIPQRVTLDTLQDAAQQRNLYAGKHPNDLGGHQIFFVADPRNSDILMYGDDLPGLLAHLLNTPAYPAE